MIVVTVFMVTAAGMYLFHRDQGPWFKLDPLGIVDQSQRTNVTPQKIVDFQSEIEDLKSRLSERDSTPRSIERDFLRVLNLTTPQLLPSHNLLPDIPHDLLRRSRTRVGDRNRFVELLHKLESGKCINVAVLGGSISTGHGIKKGDKIWWQHFADWLNVTFPCNGSHGVVSKARDAAGTN